ncbi:hypothetical protein AAFF_G00108910 [Aldrovandia affinis]|uniref:Uncharacterized protein n=1 Tax=Aldrovandia affinis TaxID=143900 RepID=A0AAD7RU57_9TELE|nr:hypothetical protein AAFF_G00108910 [Aldrovandia affinis]
MLDGAHFVELVARLCYPGASSLKGEDFDWLFDKPVHQQFLRLLYSSLNKDNVLTPEEVRTFRALRDSGKAILDEAELGEVLKACQATAVPAPSSFLRLEEADLAQLEEELQALRREKKLKTQRHKRLQVLATACGDTALRLASRREEASCHLRDVVSTLGAENAETNAALQVLTDEVKRLASFLRVEPPPEQESDGAKPAPATGPDPAQGPPVFLSQLSLDPYLHQEELNTKTLALYTQKQFFKGITDMVESSRRESFDLLDLSSCVQEDEHVVVVARRTEMARLQWAHIVAQHQLLQARAEECGNRAGFQWITETLRGKAKPRASVQTLQIRHAGFKGELQAVRGDLEALQRDSVPAALREGARLLVVPVVRGDFDLQVARQEYYTSRQDQVCSCLLRQKASFELLHLAQEMELRRGRQLLGQLRELRGRLESSGAAISQRLHTFSQPELSLTATVRPGSIISTRDAAFSRLYKVLESGSDPAGVLEEPFRTYEGLEQAARGLQEELRSVQEALAGAAREQAFTVCATPSQELCPNSQELRGQLLDLESQLNSLNHGMQEMVAEIRGKRAQLERDHAMRRERDLYVYFHLDDKQLERVVAELEGRAGGKGGRSQPREKRRLEEMEHCSQAGGPMSASAQRILAALRAQHADRVAERRQCESLVPGTGAWPPCGSERWVSVLSAGERGGTMLRQPQEEGSWSRAQESLFTGDPRGAGSGNGVGDPTFTIEFSLQGPPVEEVGVRGPNRAEVHSDRAASEREGGVRDLQLLRSDITTVGGPRAEGHGEREWEREGAPAGTAQGDRRAQGHPGTPGLQRGQWQFGRLLLRDNRTSKEDGRAGRRNEGAGSERRLAEALREERVRSYGGGDSVTQGRLRDGGDRERLQFGRRLQPGKSAAKEEEEEEVEEARHRREGALSGAGSSAAQQGFQLTPFCGREASLSEMEHVRKELAWTSSSAGSLAHRESPGEIRPGRASDGPQVTGTSNDGSTEAYRSPSVPRHGNAQGTANRVTLPKRRRGSPPPHCSVAKRPGRWEPPRSSQGAGVGGGAEAPRTPRPPTPPSALQPGRLEACREALNTPGAETSRVAPQPHNPPEREELGRDGEEQGEPQRLGGQGPSGGGAEVPKPLKQRRAGCSGRGQDARSPKEGEEAFSALVSDPAVRDAARLSWEERAQALEEVARAPALVLTMVYQDGSTQLSPKQKACPSVSGVLVLLKRSLGVTGPEEGPSPDHSLIYLRLEQRPAWAQQDPGQNQDLFTREMVLRVVTAAQLVVCYKAKDLLRTLLQHYGRDLSWKQGRGLN